MQRTFFQQITQTYISGVKDKKYPILIGFGHKDAVNDDPSPTTAAKQACHF
jgi:hypothetical protein